MALRHTAAMANSSPATVDDSSVDPLTQGMEIYLVGGAVRDELLGLPTKDRDWVVVGQSPEAMLKLGFSQVGRDFPVFLHPQTHEEYALARTERKTGVGHQGFVCHAGPDVTLEQDLERRDLTINAIAKTPAGTHVDPFGGREDLEAQCLRHVSPAFAEDPLRVYRVARFAARLPGFEVAPATADTIRALAQTSELAGLSAERVWQELSKALLAPAPHRFVEVLAATQALAPWLSELEVTLVGAQAKDLQRLAQSPPDLASRFALLGMLLDESQTQALGRRLKAPLQCQKLASQLRGAAPLLLAWVDAPKATPAEPLYELMAALGAFKPGGWPAAVLPALAHLSGADESAFAPLADMVGEVVHEVQPRRLLAEGYAGAELGAELARRRTLTVQRWLRSI